MICYTSGTTGAPKGALITHENLVSVGAVCKVYIDQMSHFGKNDYYISYLPMAHVFEHFMQTACIADGMGIGFSSGDTRRIVDDFKALRPSVFASVPRVLERLIGKVKEAIAEKNFVLRSLFQMAFNAKKARILQKNTNRCPLWDALIFKPVLAQIGLDNVRAMVTGSAPITAENLLFLRVLFLYFSSSLSLSNRLERTFCRAWARRRRAAARACRCPPTSTRSTTAAVRSAPWRPSWSPSRRWAI